jgi:hypothetical protein
MIDRMIGAARLNPRIYEEVEADTSATFQAAIVVIIVALFAGVGSAIGLIIFDTNALFDVPGGPIGVVVARIIAALVGWGVWALITYIVGTAVFDGTADWGELLRALGFAQTPGILSFFSFIPCLAGAISALVGLWTLLASLIGVRQALDFSTRKAVLTVLIGWLIYFVLNIFFTTGSAGIFGLFG